MQKGRMYMNVQHENIIRGYSLMRTGALMGNYIHWHQRTEFLYILQGKHLVTISDRQYVCEPGDFIVIHSGEIHNILSLEEGELYICTFDPNILYGLQPEIRFIQSHISREELKNAGLTEEANKFFQEFAVEKVSMRSGYEMLIQASIIRLYALLVRYFEKDTPADNKSLEKFRQFQKALTYISTNYSENITLQNIAKELNYNPNYVSTLFVTYTGVNFKNYLDTFRIRQAVKLLKSTDFTVADIAANCGYENIRTFNHAFRRITGKSPSDLRKANI